MMITGCRPWRSAAFYLLEIKCLLLLAVCLVLKPLLRRRFTTPVWVIGENFGRCLRDNGYCFFLWCRESGTVPRVLFVARREFAARDPALSGSADVLVFGSFRHLLHVVQADVVIYTHTRRDIIHSRLFPLACRGKRIVWLKHGVYGFKKMNRDYHLHRNEPDIITVVSAFEKDLLAANAGVEPHRLRVTGLARYDRLLDGAETAPRNQITYMPTFRDWLDAATLPGSVFFGRVSELLSSAALAALLERHDAVMKVYLHWNMAEFTGLFHAAHPRIHIVRFGEEGAHDLLRESRLLVTDYSSVSWDFHYLGRPVLFYQFDLDEFIARRGAYLDMRRDLFGESAASLPELVGLLEEYAANGFREKEAFAARRARFFRYRDRDNCRRIYGEIAAPGAGPAH